MEAAPALLVSQGLVALQAVLTDGTFPGQMQKAGTTNSPGKRKRGRKRWTLQELARASLPDEVSCIHIVPYTAGQVLYSHMHGVHNSRTGSWNIQGKVMLQYLTSVGLVTFTMSCLVMTHAHGPPAASNVAMPSAPRRCLGLHCPIQ